MILNKLIEQGVINVDKAIVDNCVMLAITGSESYGVATNFSDKDMKGIFIPRKSFLFPHLEGKIWGFDYPSETTMHKQSIWEKHHVKFNDITYDFRLDSITKFFKLASDCNPDIIDTLFSPTEMFSHITSVGQMIVDNRRLFLSKKCWATFRGYAFSNLHKSKHEDINKEIEDILIFEEKNDIPRSTRFDKIDLLEKEENVKSYYKTLYENGLNKTKRFEDIKINGYSTKHYYHIVRLLLECEQILTEHDLDIRKNKEYLKTIRKGEHEEEYLLKWITDKIRLLEGCFNKSTLQDKPNEDAIKNLLVKCIKHHYTDLDEIVNFKEQDIDRKTLIKIKQLIEEVL